MNYNIAYKNLFTPGTQLKEFYFNGYWDWLVKVSDVRVHWKNQPSYIISQCSYLLGGIVTFIHACHHGGRLPYLWLTTVLHGVIVEAISYVHPDVDNFWHSQTPVMLLGRRLPLHIIFLYPVFLYNSSIAVAKMRLPKWSEPFAVGLGVVLIDIPYDIVSVNFLHWTWHDTDPNIADRHYWVPWNSYYFHATFAASFTFWFHFTRQLTCKSDGKWIADKSITRELFCSLLTALLGAPGGILMFTILYHPLHDLYNIHSEVTFFILFAIFLLVTWSGDRYSRKEYLINKSTWKINWTTWLVLVHLVIHYVVWLFIVTFLNPEHEVSTGMKEPIGPCEEYVSMHTAFGMILKKRKYLCPTDYDEGYFDWHCIPNGKLPKNGSIWYTTCGTPLENHVEMVMVVLTICMVALVVFYNLHLASSGDELFSRRDKGNKNIKKKMY